MSNQPCHTARMKNEICEARIMHGLHPLHFPKRRLSLSHALRVKSAKLWLRLGDADEAVRELECLPLRSWNHPLAARLLVVALGALDERAGAIRWR
jgi:hypothetical protein